MVTVSPDCFDKLLVSKTGIFGQENAFQKGTIFGRACDLAKERVDEFCVGFSFICTTPLGEMNVNKNKLYKCIYVILCVYIYT